MSHDPRAILPGQSFPASLPALPALRKTQQPQLDKATFHWGKTKIDLHQVAIIMEGTRE